MSQETKWKFGDYCEIEQKRFGVPNEMYLYKIIAADAKSNGYVDVPVKTPAKEVIHPEMADVVRCVCCGVDEREILKFRASDISKARGI